MRAPRARLTRVVVVAVAVIAVGSLVAAAAVVGSIGRHEPLSAEAQVANFCVLNQRAPLTELQLLASSDSSPAGRSLIASALRQVVASSPSAIRASEQVYADAAGRVQSGKPYDEARMAAASDAIVAYVQAHCHRTIQ